MVLQQTGSRSSFRYRELPQDDPKRRQPVIHKAKLLLGWRPIVPIEDGLRATINYFSLRILAPEEERRASAPRTSRSRRPRRTAAEEILH
jgi:UDP-glucuronate decarboxylase